MVQPCLIGLSYVQDRYRLECSLHFIDTAAKRNACSLDFGEPKKNKDTETMQFAGIFGTRRQVSCKSSLKFQVRIISLTIGALFCEFRVNTKSPLSLSNGSTAAEIDLEHCSKTSECSTKSNS